MGRKESSLHTILPKIRIHSYQFEPLHESRCVTLYTLALLYIYIYIYHFSKEMSHLNFYCLNYAKLRNISSKGSTPVEYGKPHYQQNRGVHIN